MVKFSRSIQESMSGEIDGVDAFEFCSSKKKVQLQLCLREKQRAYNQYTHQSNLSRRVNMRTEERIAVLSKEIRLIEYYLRTNDYGES